MTDIVYIRYNKSTGEVRGRYWGNDPSEFIQNASGEFSHTSVTGFSQDSKNEMLLTAISKLEPGEDYDPETEVPVARLYYQPDSEIYDDGEIYAEAQVKELPVDND